MRIAILETGRPPEALAAAHGDYPAMMERMLGADYALTTFDAQAGELPDPAAFDGAIITGSPAGVYEEAAWIAPLLDWIRSAKGWVPLVGICFGHQAMAQALGGEVRQSERGWAIGLHDYAVTSAEPWMKPAAPTFSIAVSHQDQVVEPPPGARVFAASPFTPYAALAWEDAISFQGHPEFTPEFAGELAAGRRRRIDPELVDSALESLKRPNDRAMVADWIRTFLSRV